MECRDEYASASVARGTANSVHAYEAKIIFRLYGLKFSY
jgi:hypothetical protein